MRSLQDHPRPLTPCPHVVHVDRIRNISIRNNRHQVAELAHHTCDLLIICQRIQANILHLLGESSPVQSTWYKTLARHALATGYAAVQHRVLHGSRHGVSKIVSSLPRSLPFLRPSTLCARGDPSPYHSTANKPTSRERRRG